MAATRDHTKRKEARDKWRAGVQAEMDQLFEAESQQLDSHLSNHNSDAYWKLWCKCVEEARIRARRLTAEEAVVVRGRGQVHFERVPSHPEVATIKEEDDQWVQIRKAKIEGPVRAGRMLGHFRNLARKQQPQLEWTHEMGKLWLAIKRRHSQDLDACWAQRVDMQPQCYHLQVLVAQEIARLAREATNSRRELQRKKADQLRCKLEKGPEAERAAYALVRNAPPQPLVFLRDEGGQVTANPAKVDTVARMAWGQLYKGSVDNHAQLAAEFVCLQIYGA